MLLICRMVTYLRRAGFRRAHPAHPLCRRARLSGGAVRPRRRLLTRRPPGTVHGAAPPAAQWSAAAVPPAPTDGLGEGVIARVTGGGQG